MRGADLCVTTTLRDIQADLTRSARCALQTLHTPSARNISPSSDSCLYGIVYCSSRYVCCSKCGALVESTKGAGCTCTYFTHIYLHTLKELFNAVPSSLKLIYVFFYTLNFIPSCFMFSNQRFVFLHFNLTFHFRSTLINLANICTLSVQFSVYVQ